MGGMPVLETIYLPIQSVAGWLDGWYIELLARRLLAFSAD